MPGLDKVGETSSPMPDLEMIELEIDGKPVRVPAGTTLWDAARTVGIDIPILCHDVRLAPVEVGAKRPVERL